MVGSQMVRGIKINSYTAELARVTIWIGEIRIDAATRFRPELQPIPKPLANIENQDAVLASDAKGNPVEPDWPEANVIIRNPPFLGDKHMLSALSDEHVSQLQALYKGRAPGGPNLSDLLVREGSRSTPGRTAPSSRDWW